MDTAETYLDECMAKIEEFEGRVPWLYLDSPGLVTVGVGNMLPNVMAAERLPFHLAGTPATTDQIKADYKRVAAMSPNHLPTFYLCSSSLRLNDYTIEALLFRVVAETDISIAPSASISLRAIVDFPAPEGEEMTNNSPRRCVSVSCTGRRRPSET